MPNTDHRLAAGVSQLGERGLARKNRKALRGTHGQGAPAALVHQGELQRCHVGGKHLELAGRRICDLAAAAGTGPVIDNDRAVPLRLQPVGQFPGHVVAHAAGWIGDGEPQRAIRVSGPGRALPR